MAERARLTITPELRLGKLVLRGDPAVASAAGTALGWPLPERINEASAGDDGRAVKLGPDEYLLTVDPSRMAALVDKLAAALAGRHHALVDISARLVAIELDGPAARDTLAAACPLDLHPSVFGPDQGSRTVFGKAEVVLDCLGEARLRLLTNRSFAVYVRRLLAEAGREFGLAQLAPP
jgi:sarcosine oxidase subunit gamma